MLASMYVKEPRSLISWGSSQLMGLTTKDSPYEVSYMEKIEQQVLPVSIKNHAINKIIVFLLVCEIEIPFLPICKNLASVFLQTSRRDQDSQNRRPQCYLVCISQHDQRVLSTLPTDQSVQILQKSLRLSNF